MFKLSEPDQWDQPLSNDEVGHRPRKHTARLSHIFFIASYLDPWSGYHVVQL